MGVFSLLVDPPAIPEPTGGRVVRKLNAPAPLEYGREPLPVASAAPRSLSDEERRERKRAAYRRWYARMRAVLPPRKKMTDEERQERQKEYRRRYAARMKAGKTVRRKLSDEELRAKKAAYLKRWRAENPEKTREYARKQLAYYHERKRALNKGKKA